MTTKLTRQEQTTKEEFLTQYSKQVENVSTLEQDVQELSELQAKHPADVYIIADFKDEAHADATQGDILLWKKGSRMYNKYIGTVDNLEATESRNLQLGQSVTGDHLVVPLKNAKLSIEDCNITIQRDNGRNLRYPAKIIKSDKPFCVVHREHGNVTVPAGTYMSCVSLNPKTMTRMLD